jgi:hypothetical protein
MNGSRGDRFDPKKRISEAVQKSTSDTRDELQRRLGSRQAVDVGLLKRHAEVMADAIGDVHKFMILSHANPLTDYVKYLEKELAGIWYVYETAYDDFVRFFDSSSGFKPSHLERNARSRWTKGVLELTLSFRAFDIALRAVTQELSRDGDATTSAALRATLVDRLDKLAQAWRKIGTLLSAIKL